MSVVMDKPGFTLRMNSSISRNLAVMIVGSFYAECCLSQTAKGYANADTIEDL